MMKQRHSRALSVLMLALFLLVSAGYAGLPKKDKANRLAKPASDDKYAPFLINNIFNYYGNNGDGSYNKFSSNNEGFEFTKGTGKTVIFEDGVVWGGFHKGRPAPKVGGSVYKHGLEAGPLLTSGTALTDPIPADASDAKYHIYRVRPDVNPSTPLDDAMTAKLTSTEQQYIVRYESVGISDIYNQYISDWNNWPADEGAPYTDVDGNGVYDPTIDIPGVAQADQTLWYVANDESVTRCASLGGSPPIGMAPVR